MMDRETILRMACEAGLRNSNPGAAQEILRFASMLAASTPPTWMPIESAPKDCEIDMWSKLGRIPNCSWGQTTYGRHVGFVYQSGYDSDGPVIELVPDPTNWMPMPKAP